MPHRCQLYDVAVCLLATVRDVVQTQGSVTITETDLPELLGETDFRTNTIRLTRGLTTAQWRSTLAHELTHLRRGPAPEGQVEREEVLVEHQTAATLIPEAEQFAQLDHQWSDADARRLAQAYAVDDAVAYDALDPRTLPDLRPVDVPQQRTC